MYLIVISVAAFISIRILNQLSFIYLFLQCHTTRVTELQTFDRINLTFILKFGLWDLYVFRSKCWYVRTNMFGATVYRFFLNRYGFTGMYKAFANKICYLFLKFVYEREMPLVVQIIHLLGQFLLIKLDFKNVLFQTAVRHRQRLN